MKEGDIVYCIKDFGIPTDFPKQLQIAIFERGKGYKINGFHYDQSISLLPGPTYFKFYDPSRRHIYGGDPNTKSPKFEEHFTDDIKKLRKLKLTQIDERTG